MSVIKETYTRFELIGISNFIFLFFMSRISIGIFNTLSKFASKISSYTLFCKQSLSLAYTEQIQCIAFYIPLTLHVMCILKEN